MCGIAGKISFTKKPIVQSDILQMTKAIAHRGPDDEGIYISPNKKIGLGHCRLAVIDLSKKASQPMSYLGRYWIVFNGEIYNYQEKRKLLKAAGYRFKSQSDTEVILALYDQFGKECLKHLRGMFAFAIYDNKNNTLFCARDRIGKKPFKYFLGSDVFIFASELKAILTQKEYHKEPDFLAIHHFLTLQYCPGSSTGFTNIKKLEPAHYLYLDIKTKKIEIKRYWNLDYSQKLKLSKTEWKKMILDKLEQSVKLRMISDVPIGAFLSGGVDSSAIVGLMSQQSKNPINTFSIGFEEEKYDELRYARVVANTFKTNHTEFILRPETMDILPAIVRQYEEPFADSSALPTYFLSELTRRHVTVALNGDGGDENFAGYTRYSYYKTYLNYSKLFRYGKFLMPLLERTNSLLKNSFINKLVSYSQSLDKDYRFLYADMMSYFTHNNKKKLYTDQFWQEVGSFNSAQFIVDKFVQSHTLDKIDQVLYTDFNSYLPSDLMVKVDIASMAHGLEARSPLLDHEFLGLTAKIPSQMKLKGLTNSKYIFKQALAEILPPEILYRKKMGFGVPLDSWFRNDLAGYVSSILLSKKALRRGLFNQNKLKELIASHKSNRADNSRLLWALLTLELWFEIYFD